MNDLPQVSVMSLKPDDVLVFSTVDKLSAESYHRVEQKMRELIKTVEKLQPDKAPEKKYWPVDYPKPFFIKHDSN